MRRPLLPLRAYEAWLEHLRDNPRARRRHLARLRRHLLKTARRVRDAVPPGAALFPRFPAVCAVTVGNPPRAEVAPPDLCALGDRVARLVASYRQLRALDRP